jgi:hypothetical protein
LTHWAIPMALGPYNNKWDPISDKTAYLFTKFTNHTLSGYDWNGTDGRA